jgi:hypothetical protein
MIEVPVVLGMFVLYSVLHNYMLDRMMKDVEKNPGKLNS